MTSTKADLICLYFKRTDRLLGLDHAKAKYGTIYLCRRRVSAGSVVETKIASKQRQATFRACFLSYEKTKKGVLSVIPPLSR